MNSLLKTSEQWSPLFTQHIRELNVRARCIMQRENITALLIDSGQPITQFLDDFDYPFKVIHSLRR